MKIYTGKGDGGKTSLFSGERVEKDNPRVAAYGTLDELNSLLGAAHAFCQNETLRGALVTLQEKTFEAGADLATTARGEERVQRLRESDWKELERRIDSFQEELPPLKSFILPGGTRGAAMLHQARCVARRAERLVTGVSRSEPVNPELIVFLNRLSDYLFVLARYENIMEGGQELTWQQQT